MIQILQDSGGSVGSRIVRNFMESNERIVPTQDRQAIVRISVDFLIKEKGDFYPTTENKIHMAKSIVKAFPVLEYHGAGTKYQAFYNGNPNSAGYLDQQLKYLRKSLKMEDRKRKKEKPKEAGKNKKQLRPKGFVPAATIPDDGDVDEDMQYMVLSSPAFSLHLNAYLRVYCPLDLKVDWMKNRPPTTENKQQIIEYWASTYDFRQDQVSKLDSPTRLLVLFPRMADMDDGILVSLLMSNNVQLERSLFLSGIFICYVDFP